MNDQGFMLGPQETINTQRRKLLTGSGAAALIAAAGISMEAEAVTSGEPDNLALSLARRWIENLNRRDLDGLRGILSEDHLYSTMARNPPEFVLRNNRDKFLKEVSDTMQNRKRPVQMTIVSGLGHGNRAVLETQGYGVTDDNYEYANSYCFLYWIENNKIKRVHDYCCTHTSWLYARHLQSIRTGR